MSMTYNESFELAAKRIQEAVILGKAEEKKPRYILFLTEKDGGIRIAYKDANYADCSYNYCRVADTLASWIRLGYEFETILES